MKLRSDETALRGEWREVDGEVVADATTRRIEELSQRHLHEVGRDESGWDVLYQDPDDGRFWELTYPDSEAHGGGAPYLACVAAELIEEKYGVRARA